MCIIWGTTVFGQVVAALIAGHRKVLDLSGPAGAYNIPQPALDWKAQPGREAVPFVLLDPQSLGALVAQMDGWPKSWRSLTWMALIAEALRRLPSWLWRQATNQFDSRRRY